MMQRGIFITLEGIDGTGKATQVELLRARLEAAGHEVALFDFPRYNQPSSYFIKQYLNGAYGGVNDVSPYTAALFYALDRYEASPEIRAALESGKIVLANRFSGSSFAHQGAKIANAQERSGFYIWLDNLEFQLLGIPRPTLNVILQADAATSQALVGQKSKRAYTNKTHDIHEADPAHLATASQVYLELAQLFPRDFQVVDCMRGGVLLDVGTITDLIWGKTEPLLPAVAPAEQLETTPETIVAPDKIRNATKVSLLAEAHALAREPRTDSRLRSTALVMPYDGNRWFVTPKSLKPKLRAQYTKTMQQLRTAYDELLFQTVAYMQSSEPQTPQAVAGERAQAVAQLVMPLATCTSVTLSASMSRVSESAAFKISPADTIMRTIAGLSLPTNHTDQSRAVMLTSATPADELELLPQLLYKFSDQSLDQIRREVSTWPYDKQAATLRSYLLSELAGKGSGVLDSVTYTWDLVTDVATFRSLAPYGQDLSLQAVSPRLGYDVPEPIEQSGLTELFERCFDQSLALYSQLQQAGFTTEAQYACLLGHRLRWSVCTSGRGLATVAQLVELGSFTQGLFAATIEKHPIVATVVTDRR